MSMAVSPHPRIKTFRLVSCDRSLYWEEWKTGPLMCSMPGIDGMFGSTWRPVQMAMCEQSYVRSLESYPLSV